MGRIQASVASPPKQARSQKSLDRLLDAGEALIIKKGHRDVSITEVARRARSSVGGFYSRFRDKDELLRALHARFLGELEDLVESLERSEADASLRQLVHAGLTALVGRLHSRRRLVAAFMAAIANDPRSWQQAVLERGALVQRFQALLMERRKEIVHPDPDRAVMLAFFVVLAAVDQGVAWNLWREKDLDEVVAELERMVLSYLGIV